jgi:hypothetical protein
MTAEPAGRGASIIATHALAFLLIAYLVTLRRYGRHNRGAPELVPLKSFRVYVTIALASSQRRAECVC